MIPLQHPDELHFAQYVSFKLCAADQLKVLEHLQTCPSCKELLRMYKALGDLDNAMPSQPEELQRYTSFVLDLLKEN
jgi:anti-sigma factor RsiW